MPKKFELNLTCPGCSHSWAITGSTKEKVHQSQCPKCQINFIPTKYPNSGVIKSQGKIIVGNQKQLGLWMTLDADAEIQEIQTAWQTLLTWLETHQMSLAELKAMRSFQRVEANLANLAINAAVEEEYAFEDLTTNMNRLASNIKDAYHLVINSWEPFQKIITISAEVQSWFV